MKRPRLRSLVVPVLILIGIVVAVWVGPLGNILGIQSTAPTVRVLPAADPAAPEPDADYLFNPDKVRPPLKPSAEPVFVFTSHHGTRTDPLWPGALVLYADGAVLYRAQARGAEPPDIRYLQLSLGESARWFRQLSHAMPAHNNGMRFPPDSRYSVFQWRADGKIVAESGWRIGEEPRVVMSVVESLRARCNAAGASAQSPGDRFFPVNHPVTAPHPTTPDLKLHALDPRAVHLSGPEFEQPQFSFERHTNPNAEHSWPEALAVYADGVVYYRPHGEDPMPPPLRSVKMPREQARELMRIVQGCLNDLRDDRFVEPEREYAVIRWFGPSGHIVAESAWPGLSSDRVVVDARPRGNEAWNDIFRQVEYAAARALAMGDEIDSLRGRYFPVEHPFK